MNQSYRTLSLIKGGANRSTLVLPSTNDTLHQVKTFDIDSQLEFIHSWNLHLTLSILFMKLTKEHLNIEHITCSLIDLISTWCALKHTI